MKALGTIIAILVGFYAISLHAQVNESELKSIVIHKIINFVKWPDTPIPQNEFVLGIIGKSDLQKTIENLYGKTPVNNKKVSIIFINSLNDIQKCHAIYIAPSEAMQLDKILTTAAPHPILLISDSSGFGVRGVHINLYLEENKIKFEVNKKTVDTTPLKLSAKLYKLAKIIE